MALLQAALLGANLLAQGCPPPPRVSREEILVAMHSHGAYSLTSTTTAARFASEVLLEIVRRRERELPEARQFLIKQSDWFAAHLETAGVPYAEMSAAARAAFEHHQDALVDYRPGLVQQVPEGPLPRRVLDVTIFWPDSPGAPSRFSYRDTLSVPKVEVYDRRVIRFKLLEYDGMLVFDRITGISLRPLGFFSAVFALLGKPDLEENRIAVSPDQWQVMRGRVRTFGGIGKTGTVAIEPGGRGHEGIPAERRDLRALADRLQQPLRLRYSPPSCQVRAILNE